MPRHSRSGPVAQRQSNWTLNQLVGGSNPPGLTTITHEWPPGACPRGLSIRHDPSFVPTAARGPRAAVRCDQDGGDAVEGEMDQPIVFVSHWGVKPGALDRLRQMSEELHAAARREASNALMAGVSGRVRHQHLVHPRLCGPRGHGPAHGGGVGPGQASSDYHGTARLGDLRRAERVGLDQMRASRPRRA